MQSTKVFTARHSSLRVTAKKVYRKRHLHETCCRHRPDICTSTCSLLRVCVCVRSLVTGTSGKQHARLQSRCIGTERPAPISKPENSRSLHAVNGASRNSRSRTEGTSTVDVLSNCRLWWTTWDIGCCAHRWCRFRPRRWCTVARTPEWFAIFMRSAICMCVYRFLPDDTRRRPRSQCNDKGGGSTTEHQTPPLRYRDGVPRARASPAQ